MHNSALSFRKMLIASIKDIRILVVKLCDRIHNMLTLDALHLKKQLRISEETLIVYAPIAHRLGMSGIKNALEDLAFKYIYSDKYQAIDTHIKSYERKIQVHLNEFISDIETKLLHYGYQKDDFEIQSRVKHNYSIFLKMQRKGISFDEVLDLMAVRILLKEDIDCYKVLGVIHLDYKPIIARFKDYISTPKENGYQTIHSTVFYDSRIYEVQIRTFDMHKNAELGIAAHWIYKDGKLNAKKPDLKWLDTLEFGNDDIQEFVKNTKQDLYTEEIHVISPSGETFILPKGSTALDFAYEIHSDIGNRARFAKINTTKKPLLTEVKEGDIVQIETCDKDIPRCTWGDMVATSKAKKGIKALCSSRDKELNDLVGRNIIKTIFDDISLVDLEVIVDTLEVGCFNKISHNIDHLKNIKNQIKNKIQNNQNSYKLRENEFENLTVYSLEDISELSFAHCCHPKNGDEIVAFDCEKDNTVVIHHKMCDKAYDDIKQGEKMYFVDWKNHTLYSYKAILSMPHQKGELAKLLTHLSNYDINIISIKFGKDAQADINNDGEYTQLINIMFECDNSNKDEVRKLLKSKVKVMDFVASKDAYN
jgi:GTP pyrophosphokinase